MVDKNIKYWLIRMELDNRGSLESRIQYGEPEFVVHMRSDNLIF